MELFDSHCHMDVEEFAADREQVIQRARDAGVTHMLIPGILAATWPALIELCNQHTGLYPALGLHPIYQDMHKPEDIEALREAVKKYHPVAIGEIGLDFYIKDADREGQTELFEQQLQIAEEFNLPVVLHIRKAYDQVLQSLKKFNLKGGTAHAFNGSLQQAQQFIDMGFKLGFGGMVTFERSNKLRKLVKELPLEVMVLETDAPDMTVASHRGERNSPEYLPEVVSVIAMIKAVSEEVVAEVTTRNSRGVFGI